MLCFVALFAVASAFGSYTQFHCDDCQFGVVMGGYDVVAYFSLDESADGVKGIAEHEVKHGGYTWWFASAANADAFTRSPDKYLPAYGGFCAWGVAREGLDNNPGGDRLAPWGAPWPWTRSHMGPPCDPKTGWAVHGARLYCSIGRSVMQNFLHDFREPGTSGVEEADRRWAAWFGGASAGPLNSACYPDATLEVCIQKGRPFPNRTAAAILV